MPAFADDRPVVLFDGDCALCSGSARKILKHDRAGRIRLAPTQSPLGRALLVHYGVDPDDPYTMLLIQDGVARQRSDGVLASPPCCRRPIGWRFWRGSSRAGFATDFMISSRAAAVVFPARHGAPCRRKGWI